MEKYAIIKLSAQTIKLSLIDVAPNGYYNLFDEITETIKLGATVEQNGLIMPNIINESLTLLKLFRKNKNFALKKSKDDCIFDWDIRLRYINYIDETNKEQKNKIHYEWKI